MSREDRSSGERRRNGPGAFGQGFVGVVDKPKNFKKTFLRFMSYLKPYRLSLIIVFATAILSTAFAVLAPLLIGEIVNVLFDGIVGTGGGKGALGYSVTILLVLLLGLYLGSSLFAYIQQYIMAGVTQKIVENLRSDIGYKLSKLRLKYYDTHTNGEIMSRVLNDVDNISNTLQQGVVQLITAVVTLIGILLIMVYLNPLLAFISFLILPVSAVLTKIIISKSQPYFKQQQQEKMAQLNGHVEEMYTGHKIIKAFGREQKSAENFDEANDDLFAVSWKSQFISGISIPLLYSVQNIGYAAVCIVGCLFVLSGAMNIGNVQSFILYSKQFTQPITQISTVISMIQSTLASTEHVFALLDEEEELADSLTPISLAAPAGEVSFEHVDFGYIPGNPVIKDLNLKIRPGDSVAIVGPTGAGKTTILNLLMRFYEIDSGKIMIDNVDITEMRRHDLRGMFGMVLQMPWLFNGTVRENIAYGCESATDEEIINAAKMAYADSFIRKLPHGYDTVINEDASNISEGQKQMLTIARAFLSNPVILLLDEATSNVDTLTEVHIKEAMLELMKGRTSFVIAHRLSTVQSADLILVLNKGEIIEKGNHDELIAENGFYAMLYNSQFSSANLDETFQKVEEKMMARSVSD
jgi:ABC-type multidrug transport system, ATPase and permease components